MLHRLKRNKPKHDVLPAISNAQPDEVETEPLNADQPEISSEAGRNCATMLHSFYEKALFENFTHIQIQSRIGHRFESLSNFNARHCCSEYTEAHPEAAPKSQSKSKVTFTGTDDSRLASESPAKSLQTSHKADTEYSRDELSSNLLGYDASPEGTGLGSRANTSTAHSSKSKTKLVCLASVDHSCRSSVISHYRLLLSIVYLLASYVWSGLRVR